jgi:hypothetical protein
MITTTHHNHESEKNEKNEIRKKKISLPQPYPNKKDTKAKPSQAKPHKGSNWTS